MEVACLIGSALGFSGSVLVLMGGGANRHAAGWATRMIGRWLWAACSAAGSTYAVSLLLRLPSYRALSYRLSRELREQGILVSREGSCGMLLVAMAGASVLCGLFAHSLYGVLAGVIGSLTGVVLWHSTERRKRERALIDEMPEVFRTLAMALGSGETLTQAIEYVGMHEHGYAGEAFVHAALRLRCGSSTEDAMVELGRELDAPGVGLLTTALVIAQRTGSPLRGLFQSSAQLVERQGEYERMLAVKTAQVRLSVRIVCLLPLMIVLLLSMISVDFQQGLATPAGTASILLAACMDGCALLIIRRLMRGVI